MEDADGLSFNFEGGLGSGPIHPNASIPIAPPENSSSAAAPTYDHSAATVTETGRGRRFRQPVYRNWLRCLFMKGRDDEKEKFCSSRSKLDSIPLQSKELVRNDEKETNQRKFDPIPLDLEIEILIRLPAKSLMKLQCVSKMWSSIIRSQRFVDSYYALSSATPPDRFIIALSSGIFAKPEDNRLFIFSSSHKGDESSSLVTSLDMIIPSVCLDRTSDCIFVHGLLVCISSGPVLVCNPSTGKVTIVPCSGAYTSFGYDPIEAQFKALTTMYPYPHMEPDFLVHEVLTLGGGESSWTRNKVTSPLYYKVTKTICINGFVYSGAWYPRHREDPVIVCFDVRYERISFIKAPMSVVSHESGSIFMEYKGKLASIVRYPYDHFHRFDLWILEDEKKHNWSRQSFELPFSLGMGSEMTSLGTNKAGEIIFSPTCLSRNVQPCYIFYYNVERKDIRKVRLQGIADDEEFRHRYRIAGQCCVYISHEHVESIASL